MVLAMTKPTQKIFQSNEDSKKDDNSFSVFFSVLFLDFKRRGNNSKDMWQIEIVKLASSEMAKRAFSG